MVKVNLDFVMTVDFDLNITACTGSSAGTATRVTSGYNSIFNIPSLVTARGGVLSEILTKHILFETKSHRALCFPLW